MKRGRRWTFLGRMMRLNLLSTTVLVLGLSVASYLYLENSVRSELDALTSVHLKDFRLEFGNMMRPPAAPIGAAAGAATDASEQAPPVPDKAELEEIARRIAKRQRTPVAWRLWQLTWNRVYFEMGRVELLTDDMPAIGPTSVTLRPTRALRTRTELLSHGYVVGLVLDGSEQVARLQRFQAFATGLLVFAALVSLTLGAFMIQRMTRLLHKVAESARKAKHPTSEEVVLEVADAPEEIRDVIEALRDVFSNIRAESERNRVFYASMAHELRSPIQNLVGETEVALFKQRDGDAYRRVLESNLDELRDLGDAIDNLVTICSERKLDESGAVEEFDLLDEARIRLSRESAQAQRHGVDLRLEGRGPLTMRGDREGILRALRNLAANAIQWSPEGSVVEVDLVGQNGRIEVTVDDAGPGIPEEIREQIFAPFYRGPSAAGQRIGYGLGLAIVRSAVDAQGGGIEIGRSPAGGARFHLWLPREARAQE